MYDILYADPPWHYRTWDNKNLTATDAERRDGRITPYKPMTTDDICNMDIRSNPNSVLCLWGTWPCLPDSLKVMESWGFGYKTVLFVWVKMSKLRYFFGLGYYTRANTEFCLIGTKGKGLPVLDHSISQLHVSPVKSHSRKPDAIADKIVRLFGDRPRIELFARRLRFGWDVFGNDPKLNLSTLDEHV